MHFEVLVEDISGKRLLDILLPRIIGPHHTHRVISYKGVGRIPSDLRGTRDPEKRILLDNLPKLLRGYGKTFTSYPAECPAAVVLVCDLDNKCLKDFRKDLFAILDSCRPQPETRFCIAIEEGEAWLLGDREAVISAFPNARENVLRSYENDSICGTWERLADAVYRGGSRALASKGWQDVGKEKSDWAERIGPHMIIGRNQSPSFQYFVCKLTELSERVA